MLAGEGLQLLAHAPLAFGEGFAAGEAEAGGGGLDGAPGFGAGKLFQGLAGPLAGVGLDQAGAGDHGQVQRLGQWLGGLQGTFQRGAVDGYNGGGGELLGDGQGLLAAFLVQAHAGQAAGQAVFFDVVVLAVTDEQDGGHGLARRANFLTCGGL